MKTKIILSLYISIGFLLNSLLHIFYVVNSYKEGMLRFLSLPFLQPYIKLSKIYGIFGSIILGALSFGIVLLSLSYLPELGELGKNKMILLYKLKFIILINPGLLFISQLIAGTAWSKMALDGMVLFTGFLVLLSYAILIPIWGLIALYITLGGVLFSVTMAWKSHVNIHHFPNFTAFSYFIISGAYSLRGSFYFIIPNIKI